MEKKAFKKTPKINYPGLHPWESYFCDLPIEYQQSIEEGLDIEEYKEVFDAVSKLPKTEMKMKLADVLFDIVINANIREGYAYDEPSELDAIKALRGEGVALPAVDEETLEKKVHGAWMGRICGCLLGKPLEGYRTDVLIPALKATDNYPLHRYIVKADASDEMKEKYNFHANWCYADQIDGMPVDDDTNYIVLGQKIIDDFGRDFNSYNVSGEWMGAQQKGAYCTAERAAYCNFVAGFLPPDSAIYKNPYREWIGAQIRGDYYGYINPGDPDTAADMAFRDASISHIKNGIYGEMFASAMIAAAAATDDMKTVIKAGISMIPKTSRLFESVSDVLKGYESGVSKDDCFADIHKRWDEHTQHGWCHTIPNAMIVAAALLYGEGDYSKSICMAVETGFDTDCNGATVGSVVGMAKGIDSIGENWTAPIKDTLHTCVFGRETVVISEAVKHTMEHIRSK
jgi:hypothetical protein